MTTKNDLESDDEWEDMEEEEEENQPCRDLFSSRVFHNVSDMLENCKAVHKFDLCSFCKAKNLDFYGRIKLINFIRSENPHPSALIQAESPFPWTNEKYLKPVLSEDPILHWGGDLDSDSDDAPSLEDNEPTETLQLNAEPVSDAALARARELEEDLTEARNQLDRMRNVVQDLVAGDSQKDSTAQESDDESSGDEDSYFGSYSHFGIHREMLQDKVRTDAYRDFMMSNKALFHGKIVLDVGCGTGILSMIAAQCGAKKVIGVDNSKVLYNAMEIVRENKLESTVTLIKGKIEDVHLPVQKVDIIISEWMGYFLLFESMLESVLFARDRWLSPGGKVFPDKFSIHVAAFDDEKMWKSHIGYWDDVYGFQMGCMKKAATAEAVIATVNSEAVLTDSCLVKTIDVESISEKELDFESDFQLKVLRTGSCAGLVGYFDVEFNGDNAKIAFSCSPSSTPTHWQQTVFFLPKPTITSQGDIIKGKIACKRNHRALEVDVTICSGLGKDYSLKYYVQ
eukprot:m.137231 g.137231  ORF g.137231 m.137231 type:complete len:511 (+) comp38216_c0_seq2:22-1554(+)